MVKPKFIAKEMTCHNQCSISLKQAVRVKFIVSQNAITDKRIASKMHDKKLKKQQIYDIDIHLRISHIAIANINLQLV